MSGSTGDYSSGDAEHILISMLELMCRRLMNNVGKGQDPDPAIEIFEQLKKN